MNPPRRGYLWSSSQCKLYRHQADPELSPPAHNHLDEGSARQLIEVRLTQMSAVSILGEVCVERNPMLGDHAQLGGQSVKFQPDLLKFIVGLAMLVP